MKMTAIKALELGWSVIPVKEDKRPYIKWHPYQSNRPDRDTLAEWNRKHKPRAWAVVTGKISGIVVLDFDGDEGLETLERLGLEPHVRTGSGGYHVYVEHPGFEVKTLNSKSKQELGRRYPGLDIRADGGYAVFCGRNGSGKYTWLKEPVPYPISILPPDLRAYLGLEAQRDMFSETEHEVSADQLLTEALEDSSEGRNNAGFHLAVRLRDSGCSRKEAERVMRDYQSRVSDLNAKGMAEPYTVKEALASLDEVYREVVVIKHKDGRVKPDEGDEEEGFPVKARPWPEPLAPEAYHGLAGEVLRVLEPHTEADPAALLFSFLICFGSLIGRSAYFTAEADKHFMNLFVVQVGMSAKGRKGSSLGRILDLVKLVDAEWASESIQSGLSSGEGLIWAVRDPIEKEEPIKENKHVVDYQAVVIDPGVADKRLLVVEGEFAGTLRVLDREGNTLSAVLRNAWDSGDLRVLTKNSQAKATGAHISIIGHITKDELLRYLDRTEAGNGFGNRFLWVCVRRSKILPEGGKLRPEKLTPLMERLSEAVEHARRAEEMFRDEDARKLWYEVYPELSEGKPGLLGAVIARAEAQVMRLACIYALLDCSSIVRVEHLRAALAVWKYSEESARFIFGDAIGDPVADELLRVLKANPEGLTRTEISKYFGHNRSAREIGRALVVLLEQGLVQKEQERIGEGRPTERWRAISPLLTKSQRSTYEINEINEISPTEAGDISLNSFISYPDSGKNEPSDIEWEEGVI